MLAKFVGESIGMSDQADTQYFVPIEISSRDENAPSELYLLVV